MTAEIDQQAERYNDIMMKLDDHNIKVKELADKVENLSKRLSEKNVILLNSSAKTPLILLTVIYIFLTGFVLFEIWHDKVAVHEAWLLGVVFTGLFVITSLLIKYLFQKDE